MEVLAHGAVSVSIMPAVAGPSGVGQIYLPRASDLKRGVLRGQWPVCAGTRTEDGG